MARCSRTWVGRRKASPEIRVGAHPAGGAAKVARQPTWSRERRCRGRPDDDCDVARAMVGHGDRWPCRLGQHPVQLPPGRRQAPNSRSWSRGASTRAHPSKSTDSLWPRPKRACRVLHRSDAHGARRRPPSRRETGPRGEERCESGGDAARTAPPVPRRSLTPAEARQLLAAAVGERLESLLVIGVTVGLRPGELGGLSGPTSNLTGALQP